MATGPGASPTSATLFPFALDPENARSASSRSNFRVQVRSVGSEENEGGGQNRTARTVELAP